MALKTVGSSDPSEIAPDIVAEINITPLTDVFLVLLIIFMVTSSVMSQMGVDVKLPSSKTAHSQSQPEGVIVTLLSQGDVKIDRETFKAGSYAGFEKRLKEYLGRSGSKLVILEGDRQAFLGSAITVMDMARRAGAEQFAIATQPE